MTLWQWILFACLTFGILPSTFAAETMLEVPVDPHGTFLGPYIDFIKRDRRDETLEELLQSGAFAQATRQDREIPNFGLLHHAIYWGQVTLHNSRDGEQEVFILNKYAAIDRLTLYQPRAEGGFTSVTMGDQEPYTERLIPYRFPIYVLKLPPGATTLYFRMETGSAQQWNLSLWSPKHFLVLQASEDVMLGSIIGISAVMCLYNFFIYLNFRSKAYLYYVIYILGFATFTCNFQGFNQQVLFPEARNHFLGDAGYYLVIDFCVFFATSFARAFLEMRERLPRFNRFLIGWQVVTLLNALNGLTFNFLAHPLSVFNNIITAAFLLTAGILLMRSFSPSRVYVLAWSFLLGGTTLTVLSSGGMIPNHLYFSWSQPLGAIFEFILLSLALSQRVALINREKHALQNELLATEHKRIAEREAHIRNLDHLVADRTRDIRSILQTISQGIFVIGLTDGKPSIQGEYSRELQAMMRESLLQGKDPLTHIFAKFQISGDRLNQIKGFLDIALGSSQLSFELNVENLLREATLVGADGTLLSYEIDWSPMVSEAGDVEKILVTLRDVTQIRALRALSDRQDLETSITLELVGAQGVHFPALHRRGLDLTQPVAMDPEAHRRVHASLHTLKGEARVCGFTNLAEAIHETESSVNTESLQRLRRLLDVYAETFQKLGGRERETDEVRAPIRPLERILLRFEKTLKGLLPEQMQPQFQAIYGELNLVLGTELQAVLSRYLAHLQTLARDLNKATPNVVFKGESTLIPKAYHQTLQETFGHLLSNTMAHSLESREERYRLGKGPAGTITIRQSKTREDLIIEYRDDGRGLDLKRIREVARERNGNEPIETLSPAELANFIFRPGFSTQERVTLTAGRGVGLDAVRSALKAIDAEIHALLDQPSSVHEGCYDFHFLIHIRIKSVAVEVREPTLETA